MKEEKMRLKRAAALFTALALVGVVGTVEASAQDERQVQSSKTIHEQAAKHSQEVANQLLKIATPETPYDYISFYLSGPAVVLQGFTAKPVLKDAAQKRVENLDWVVHVVNEIEIVNVNATTQDLRSQVLGMVEKAAPQAFPENHANIRVKVTDTFDVTLVGVVDKMSKTRLDAAVVQIKNLPLVKSVTNHVLVEK